MNIEHLLYPTSGLSHREEIAAVKKMHDTGFCSRCVQPFANADGHGECYDWEAIDYYEEIMNDEKIVFQDGVGTILNKEELPVNVQAVLEKIEAWAEEVLDHSICIDVVEQPNQPCAAFGDYYLILNLGAMPIAVISDINDDLISLIIHEFSHAFSGSHESPEFRRANCDIGAKMVRLATEKPELFLLPPYYNYGGDGLPTSEKQPVSINSLTEPCEFCGSLDASPICEDVVVCGYEGEHFHCQSCETVMDYFDPCDHLCRYCAECSVCDYKKKTEYCFKIDCFDEDVREDVKKSDDRKHAHCLTCDSVLDGFDNCEHRCLQCEEVIE